MSLKKYGGVISKNYCLILWSPNSTPAILVSASVEMASTSATVIYNKQYESGPPLVNSSYKGKRISFKLDIGVCNFNHANEFVSITRLKKGRINLQRTNL